MGPKFYFLILFLPVVTHAVEPGVTEPAAMDPQEIVNPALEEKLQRMDLNQDSLVSADEWKRSSAAFMGLDINGDDLLTRRELAGEVMPDIAAALPESEGGENLAVKKVEDTPQPTDRVAERVNENREETAALPELAPIEDEAIRPDVVGERSYHHDLFSQLDGNGDNHVSSTEWPGSPRVFFRMDPNGDNLISRDEYLSAVNTDLNARLGT